MTRPCLHQGQEVIIQPAGTASRIRAIQSFNKEVKSASPGTRTALNLTNVQPESGNRDGTSALTVRRGCVVTLPGLGSAHHICELLLERSPRIPSGGISSARLLKEGTRVRFHTGSASASGRLYFSARQELGIGDRCLAQIRLESPVYAFAGDRFVIRDMAERLTLGGGVVLDPCASRKSLRCRAWKLALSAPTPDVIDPQIAITAQLQLHRVVSKASLLVQSNFSPVEVERALLQLSARGWCTLAGDFVFEINRWNCLRERARALIETCHKAHPEQAGLPLAELRSTLNSQLPLPGIFEVLVADLLATGFAQAGSVIKRVSHRPALPPQLQPVGAKIRAALALKPLDPPSRRELAPDRPGQEALAFLVRAGEVVEIGPEIVLATGVFARASETVCQFLRQHGSATVSELRQALEAGRRVVVPLLEKLDRQGVTRREGDKRSLPVTIQKRNANVR